MKKISIIDLFYFIGFFCLCLLNWEFFSSLINFSVVIKLILLMIISMFFLLTILVSKYSFKELLIVMFVLALLLLSYYTSDNYYIFINVFSILASKKINIRNIIKFIFIFNLSLLLLHIFLSLIGVNYNQNIYYTFLDGYSRKTLNLRHPNYLAALMFWTFASFIYLKQSASKLFKIFLLIIFSGLTYYLTYSRTIIIMFILLFLFIFFDSKIVLQKVNKYIKIIVLIIISLETYLAYNYFGLIKNFGLKLSEINDILSSRLYLNALAVKKYPITFLGDNVSIIDNFKLTLDSFYISCLVYYGVLVLTLFLLSYILFKGKKYYNEFVLLSILMIAALMERYTIYITLAFPLLFYKLLLFSNKDFEGEKK